MSDGRPCCAGCHCTAPCVAVGSVAGMGVAVAGVEPRKGLGLACLNAGFAPAGWLAGCACWVEEEDH